MHQNKPTSHTEKKLHFIFEGLDSINIEMLKFRIIGNPKEVR